MGWRQKREIVVVHVDGDKIGGVWFGRMHVLAVRGGDEDHAAGVSSLTNEEPLVVVKACVNIMWEVIQEDCGYSHDSVVRKGEAPLRRGGSGSVRERACCAEDGNISHCWGRGSHRGSKVFTSRGSDENVIGIDGDILMKRSKEEGIEDFLSYLGRSGRHC